MEEVTELTEMTHVPDAGTLIFENEIVWLPLLTIPDGLAPLEEPGLV